MNVLEKAETKTETKQYLTFKLENETFAVDVSQAREILELPEITRVPNTAGYMKGVINVRGSVVQVADLRLMFGLPEGKRTINTCIVVLEVDIEGETSVIGAMADSVQEVIELDESLIEPPPRLGMKLRKDFIKGIGKRDDKFFIILDMNRVFSAEDVRDAEGQSVGAG